jgi:hypothetical protein
VESAEHYQVALYDFESTLIWESVPVTETAVIIPEPVRERLLPSRPYYWRVFVQTDAESHQSALLQFVITTGLQK